MRLDTITTLTFGVVGTLIDFETGILEWYRPWLREHRQKADDEALLTDFAEAEERLLTEYPEMPFTAMLPRIHAELAARRSIDTDDADALDFRDSIRDWPAFPDAATGLRTLAERFRVVAVTNADAWALERMSGTLGDPFHDTITADMVGVNKPDPRVWQYMLDRLAVQPEQVLHCAHSAFHDLASAEAFGLATARIDRRHDRPGTGATPPVDTELAPVIDVRSFPELIAALEPAQ